MSSPLTPRQIVELHDKYIVRHARAKRAIASPPPHPCRRQLEDREIELHVEQRTGASGILRAAGMQMDVEMESMFEKMLPTKRETRRATVRDARKILFSQEADKLLDRDKIHATAIQRVE